MKALTVIAFLMAGASLALQLYGLPERLAPVNVTLPPMQVTVQSATPAIEIKPSEAYINVPQPPIRVEPVIHVEPAVPKIENIVKPAKVEVWCPY